MCRAGIENVSDALRGLSPGLVKQLLPIFDQLTPIYMDVAQVRGVEEGGCIRGWGCCGTVKEKQPKEVLMMHRYRGAPPPISGGEGGSDEVQSGVG